MRKFAFILTILAVIIISCEENTIEKESENLLPPDISEISDSSLLEEDNYFLEYLSQEISEIAGEQLCVDEYEWRYTPIGTKACGGPKGYVAYSIQTDTVAFLDKVIFFTIQQDVYNKKWGIFSDCSVPPQPEGIICVNGKPEFYY